MTRKEFIKVLKENDFSYKIEGDKIAVTRGDEDGDVDLGNLTTLPSDVKFENKGYVDLHSLTTLPAGVKFENKGDVDLDSLTTLPADVKFENKGDVDLRDLTTLPAGVEFKNKGYVSLNSLTTIPAGVKFKNKGYVSFGVKFNNDVSLDALVGGWFDEWKGNIKGIDSNRLLNFMINKGLFER